MTKTSKKTILIVIASLSGVCLLAAGIWYLVFINQFLSYSDVNRGFLLKYPKQWERIINPEGGAAAVFLSPKETALDTFRENVTISIEAVPAHLASLKNFSDRAILQMTKVFKNVTVTDSREITFANRKGWRVEFTTEKPEAMKIVAVWTIKGAQQAYILMYLSNTAQYKTYLPLVENMIGSFELIP